MITREQWIERYARASESADDEDPDEGEITLPGCLAL